MVASPVSFSVSQVPAPSSNKSTTFHRIIPIPDCTIGFVSPEKEKDNTLKKRKLHHCKNYCLRTWLQNQRPGLMIKLNACKKIWNQKRK